MGVRKVPLVPGEYYHIYNRGNSKQVIFKSPKDYQRFIRLLLVAKTHQSFKIEYLNRANAPDKQDEPLVSIGAFCLMPNHFHLLVTPVTEHGVSKMMQKISTSYSMYFNNKYERTGALFEGRFKAQYVGSDRYLKYLYSYIHLNPVKLMQSDWKEKGITNSESAYQYTATYQYSSLPAYIDINHSSRVILSPRQFPDYFETAAGQKAELLEWLTFNQDTI